MRWALSGAVIALIPLKKNEPWAWWTTLLIGAVIYGGYFLAIPITGGGAPGILDDVVFGFLGLVHIVALALSWNALKTPGAIRP